MGLVLFAIKIIPQRESLQAIIPHRDSFGSFFEAINIYSVKKRVQLQLIIFSVFRTTFVELQYILLSIKLCRRQKIHNLHNLCDASARYLKLFIFRKDIFGKPKSSSIFTVEFTRFWNLSSHSEMVKYFPLLKKSESEHSSFDSGSAQILNAFFFF